MEKKPKIPKQIEDLEDISEIKINEHEQKSLIDSNDNTNESDNIDLRDENIEAMISEDASPSEIGFICDMMKIQFPDEDD